MDAVLWITTQSMTTINVIIVDILFVVIVNQYRWRDRMTKPVELDEDEKKVDYIMQIAEQRLFKVLIAHISGIGAEFERMGRRHRILMDKDKHDS